MYNQSLYFVCFLCRRQVEYGLMNDPTCEISDEDLTSLLSKSDKIRHTLVFLDVWEFKGSRIEGRERI